MRIRVERWSETTPPVATELRRRMEAEGYTVSEHSDSPGTVHSPHDHEDDQSIWVISGTASLRVGDVEYTLGPGDRDYLPAHTEHSAVAAGDEVVVYLVGIRN